MFDTSLAGPAKLADVSDAALLAAVSGWAQASAAAEARKLAAIAEVERRACAGGQYERDAVDGVDAAAAQVSCALGIGHGRAVRQIELAVTLRERLPRVAARFLAGHISGMTVAAISARTCLVTDEAALAQIDAAVAEHAGQWGRLSQFKVDKAIDYWVDRWDPDAVRRVREGVRGRDFTVGYRDDATGTVNVSGRLSVTDGIALGQRIASMTAGVCYDDPRTLGQRRADALGALAAGSMFLACRCDDPGCVAKVDDGRGSSFLIHVIADGDTLDTPTDPDIHGQYTASKGGDEPESKSESESGAEPESESGAEPESESGAEPPAAPESPKKAALIPGSGGAIVPATLLAELLAHGAATRFISPPAGAIDDRYHPSVALQDFVRARDMTCRFPGCDLPAAYADIDHTRPWPAGPTHPANLKCYCRKHHLIKTFRDGFDDRQHPDGTLTITTPAGLIYTTRPFSTLLFPAWNTTTPPPPAASPPPDAPKHPARHLKMPTRRRTRSQNRAARITAERRLNAQRRAAEAVAHAGGTSATTHNDYWSFLDHPYPSDYGNDPPPF